MPSLPALGSSNWGAKLNAWLRVAHNDDGTLREASAAAPAPEGLALRATTGVDGQRLTGGAGTIIGWAAPDDGELHRALVWGMIDAVGAVTGGVVKAVFTTPAGSARSVVLLDPAGRGPGFCVVAVKPGTMVSLVQATVALGGPAVLYADIWGL